MSWMHSSTMLAKSLGSGFHNALLGLQPAKALLTVDFLIPVEGTRRDIVLRSDLLAQGQLFGQIQRFIQERGYHLVILQSHLIALCCQ